MKFIDFISMVDCNVIDTYANILIRKICAMASLEKSFVLLVVIYLGFELHLVFSIINIFLIYYKIYRLLILSYYFKNTSRYMVLYYLDNPARFMKQD